MKTINKHYSSAIALLIFGIIAFACTTVKQGPTTSTQETKRYSTKQGPVYKKIK